MKKSVTFFGRTAVLLICIFWLSDRLQAQTATLADITANPGQGVLVPLNFTGLTNVGAVSLFIIYDTTALSFTGITNLIPEAAGTLANALVMNNYNVVGLSWLAPGSSGVNFPDGKFLDIEFHFKGGSSGLVFYEAMCEIVDWDLNPIPVVYTNGSISAPGINLDLKVYLEGPYNTNTSEMNTSLNTQGFIPLNQPYGPALPYYGNNNPKWYYTGTESVAVIPGGVVDWVLIELRDASSAANATGATVEGKQALFLLADGSVVNLDGGSTPVFNVTIDQGLFVVVWHRNHIAIMNDLPIPGVGNTYTYDFSTGSAQVFGGVNGHKQIEPGVWGMISAEGNADSQVNNGDKIEVWKLDAGSSGYLGGDFSLDGQCNSQDKVDQYVPNAGSSSQVPN
ncbi:MAG: hypothetical protein JW861_05510 [Bacteroidales bacterium]|nr:hypothetical protein [Bacteroidales bacterium]